MFFEVCQEGLHGKRFLRLKIACETDTVLIIELLFVISRKSSFVVPPSSNTFSDWIGGPGSAAGKFHMWVITLAIQ